MPLGTETGNYKPKVNENDLSAQMLLLEVKGMSYLQVMKNNKYQVLTYPPPTFQCLNLILHFSLGYIFVSNFVLFIYIL